MHSGAFWLALVWVLNCSGRFQWILVGSHGFWWVLVILVGSAGGSNSSGWFWCVLVHPGASWWVLVESGASWWVVLGSGVLSFWVLASGRPCDSGALSAFFGRAFSGVFGFWWVLGWCVLGVLVVPVDSGAFWLGLVCSGRFWWSLVGSGVFW